MEGFWWGFGRRRRNWWRREGSLREGDGVEGVRFGGMVANFRVTVDFVGVGTIGELVPSTFDLIPSRSLFSAHYRKKGYQEAPKEDILWRFDRKAPALLQTMTAP